MNHNKVFDTRGHDPNREKPTLITVRTADTGKTFELVARGISQLIVLYQSAGFCLNDTSGHSPLHHMGTEQTVDDITRIGAMFELLGNGRGDEPFVEIASEKSLEVWFAGIRAAMVQQFVDVTVGEEMLAEFEAAGIGESAGNESRPRGYNPEM